MFMRKTRNNEAKRLKSVKKGGFSVKEYEKKNK